jgi:hypothetical protein
MDATRAKRLRLHRERQQRCRARQSQETFERLLQQNTERMSQRRQQETEEETQARREVDAEAHRQAQQAISQVIRDESLQVSERQIALHDCGPMDTICQFCASRNLAMERPTNGMFNSCCHNGKVRLQKPQDADGNELEYPYYLRQLMSDPAHPHYSNFGYNIRSQFHSHQWEQKLQVLQDVVLTYFACMDRSTISRLIFILHKV